MPAHRIPPIQCLVTFESLARLRHVGQVAEELHVTPSSVGQRIRQLESLLGFKLFVRGDFTPTGEGATYLAQVRQGLAALQQMPRQAAPPVAPRLRLAVTPTFSRQILLPRLALFRHAFPEIELTMQVMIPLMDVKAEPVDLEIRFGTEPPPSLDSVRLLSDEVCPACSPECLAELDSTQDFTSARAFEGVRLIRSPLEPWSTWFESFGIARDEPREGATFNDVGLMLDAAVAGFGVTLVRRRLGAAWLEDGRLVRLSRHWVASPHHHFLCWRPGTLDRWECAAFADWLQAALRG